MDRGYTRAWSPPLMIANMRFPLGTSADPISQEAGEEVLGGWFPLRWRIVPLATSG